MLFAECRVARKSTPEDAVHVRQKLISHSQLPADAFFLLAMPSRLFLWNTDRELDAAPNFTADAKAAIQWARTSTAAAVSPPPSDFCGPLAANRLTPQFIRVPNRTFTSCS